MTQHKGFHAKNGWYFQREDGGSVRVTVDELDGASAEVTFDPDTWASIVASVSFAGEHGDGFRHIQWVHNAWPHDWVFQHANLRAFDPETLNPNP